MFIHLYVHMLHWHMFNIRVDGARSIPLNSQTGVSHILSPPLQLSTWDHLGNALKKNNSTCVIFLRIVIPCISFSNASCNIALRSFVVYHSAWVQYWSSKFCITKVVWLDWRVKPNRRVHGKLVWKYFWDWLWGLLFHLSDAKFLFEFKHINKRRNRN